MATAAEVFKQLTEAADKWLNEFKPLYLCCETLKADISGRLFDSGKDSNDAEINPDYSTKELYVDPQTLPRSVSAFQTGKRGQPIRSAYFPGGYAQLKQAIGRPVLELTNQLQSDFDNSPQRNDGEVVEFVLEKFNADKLEGLERKYGILIAPTEDEETLLAECLAETIINELNEPN